MDYPEFIGDSQSDDQSEDFLSWTSIPSKSPQRTRKEQQLQKLHKDLTPLTKEYNDIRSLRTRHTSFEKNSQYTVMAAEFLNLSTRKELNQIFEDGQSKELIEDLLERKYQEKKDFFTQMNIKHHRFKRKNFESWRSLSNSNYANTNTFIAEEELVSELPKNVQLRLKRLNNKPLISFKPDLKKSKQTKRSEKREQIPEENGLLDISIEQNSSLMITADADSKSEQVHNNKVKDNQDIKDVFGFMEQDTIYDTGIHIQSEPISREDEHDTNILFDQTTKVTSLNHINSQPSSPINHTSFSKTMDLNLSPLYSEHPSSEDIQNSLIELNSMKINTPKTLEKNSKIDEVEPNLDGTILSPVNDGLENLEGTISNLDEYKNDNSVAVNGRHLRHRTIINRNPYLVDRAEYLGLSTRYQLSSMEKDGKTDDMIVAFLDEIYQKRRMERKKKDVGYGPFSKPSFYDIMDTVDPLNFQKFSPLPLNKTETNVSDIEFEFSMGEEDDVDEENPVTSENESAEDLDLINSDPVNSTSRVTSKTDKSNSTTKKTSSTSSAKVSKLVSLSKSELSLSKKSHVKDNSKKHLENLLISSKNPNQDKSKFEHRVKISKPKKSNTAEILNNNKNRRNASSDPTSFNPYSMDSLTLLDESSQTGFSDLKALKSKHLKSKNLKEASATLERNSSKASGLQSSARRLLSDVGLTSSASSNGNFKKRAAIENSDHTLKSPTKKKKFNSSKNVVAASFAPNESSGFVFARKPLIETNAVEGTMVKKMISDEDVATFPELNVENAKGVSLPLEITVGSSKDVLSNEQTSNSLIKIDAIWGELKSVTNRDEKKYKFLAKVRPENYSEIRIPQTFLSSTLLVKTLDDSDHFYKNKSITLDFQGTTFVFSVPIAENSFHKLKAFLNLLLGSLESSSITFPSLKQLRKCLIHLIILIWNIKKDAPELLVQIGLELNSFLNKYKKLKLIDEQSFCVIAPYFLLYMNLLQKLIANNPDDLNSFRNTSLWLTKKMIYFLCDIPFENIFVHRKTVLLESLNLFLKCVRNPWSHMESALKDGNTSALNVTNFLFYCQSVKEVEMDWEIFISLISYHSSSINFPMSSSTIYEVKSIFASILKINKELMWEFENQLIIKMFRLLAEYKFENIGWNGAPKSSMYPGIPATDSLDLEDGCLEMYFKVLNIFSKQYMSDSSRQMVERIIPVRSTAGYSPVQLQNRAKVLLLMVYIFDQDLLSAFESILQDMIRDGSTYSVNAALSLLKTIINKTPKRPYKLVRKFLPLLINKINKLQNQRESLMVFKDLLISVHEFLNGQDISYLKRMLDFLAIILKLKIQNGYHFGLDKIYDECFKTISQQFSFADGIPINQKDEERLKKGLSDIVANSKTRLTDERFTEKEFKRVYLKLWLYANSKLGSSAMQVLYTEWSYFGSPELRKQFELTFFQYLIEWFDPLPVKAEIFGILFKYLPFLATDVSGLYNAAVVKGLLKIDKEKFKHVTAEKFYDFREKITVLCLSSLLRIKEKSIVIQILNVFAISLKEELLNHSSRNYIKDVTFYLYTVADQMIDSPEWKYLVQVLKIETIAESLSKKMQFVETVEDIATVLEKNYITSLAGGTYKNFVEQIKLLSGENTKQNMVVCALCDIVRFHSNQVIKTQVSHWVHTRNWIQILSDFLQLTFCQSQMGNILELLKYMGLLRTVYTSHFEYKYYYVSVLFSVYAILEWAASMLIGFSDMNLLLENFTIFTAMDPVFDILASSDKCLEVVHFSAEEKLAELFINSQKVLKGTCFLQVEDEATYELEKEVLQLKENLKRELKIS